MKRAGVLAALALLATGCGGSSGAEEDPAEKDDSTKAGIMCERFVEQRIDRSDIEHGDWQEARVAGKGYGPYVVQSRFSVDGPWVDYTCKVRHVPDSDEWRLLELTVAR